MGLKEVGVRLVAEGGTEFSKTLQGGETAVKGFANAAETSSGGIGRFASSAITSLESVGKAALALGAVGATAFGAFLASSVNTAADYETTLNRFSAVTGGALKESGQSLDDFSRLFLQLGSDTQFSAEQAAQAAVELAKGGVDPATISAGGLKAALDLAAAGELELAQAAEITAKQYGVWVDESADAATKADFLAQSSDLLAQAANASTVNVDDLALGLSNVGGVAKNAGLSFDETVQTMALIAPGFSSAADAGTSFKTFLNGLIPTTTPAILAMEDLGLYTEETGSAFYDAQGNFVGMEKASQLLYDATKDLTDEQRSLALETIFGSDAVRTAAKIAEGGSGAFNDMGMSMDAAGTAAEQAAARNKGFNFALETLKGSLETLQIVVGTAVLPIITAFINTITTGVNKIIEFAQEITNSGTPLEGIGEKVGSLSSSLGEFIITAIPKVLEGLGTLISRMLAWVTTSLPGWLTALGAFGKGAVQWILDAIPSLLSSLGTFLQSLIGTLLNYLPEWGAKLLEFGIKAVSWIGDQLPALGEALGEFFNRMVTWVADNLPIWVDKLKELGLKAVEWVLDALPGLAANLGTFAGTLIGWIIQTAIDVIPKLADLGFKFLSWIVTDVIPKLPEWLAKIAESIFNFISNLVKEVVPKLADLGQKFLDEVQKIPGIILGIGDKLYEAGKNIIDSMLGGIQAAWDGMVGWVEQGLADLTDLLPFSPPKDPNSPLHALPAGGEGIIRQIQSGINKASLSITPALGDISGVLGNTTVTPPAQPSQLYQGATYNNENSVQYNFQANYAYQSEASLMQDVKMMQMLRPEL